MTQYFYGTDIIINSNSQDDNIIITNNAGETLYFDAIFTNGLFREYIACYDDQASTTITTSFTKFIFDTMDDTVKTSNFNVTSAGKITYTGDDNKNFVIKFSTSAQISTNATAVTFFNWYKNDQAITGQISRHVLSKTNAIGNPTDKFYRNCYYVSFTSLAKNDYIELYLQTDATELVTLFDTSITVAEII